MIRALLIAGLMLIGMSSCRSSRNIDSSVNAEQAGTIEQLRYSIDSLSGRVKMYQKETIERLKNIKVENKTVYYSKPDSMGQQYPIKVSETKGESTSQENEKTDTEFISEVTILSAKVDNLSARLETLITKKEETAELSWWDLHKDKIYLCVIIVLAGLFAYKSFK